MDRDIIQARVRRSGFPELAGDLYFAEGSNRLRSLIAEFSTPPLLFALYESSDLWTALSETALHFRVCERMESLPVAEAGEVMHDCHYKAGKAVDLEYIDRGASLPIWVINTEVSNAIQNVILLLERNILSGLARVQH